ncbi:hypothetical protein [Actinomadura alba]|uniref:Uncharacterized protein n=1 Tax=Actinomadura alba TaxID=406431 RepID=A0ABR7LWG3_9ACTN|nr:hypothetical protein [Actinomadura alba]MBC6468763.1 hypothetical protein [Actinomadura alba]
MELYDYATVAAVSGAVRSANGHTFGGLSDAAFPMIPLLKAGRSQTWPF